MNANFLWGTKQGVDSEESFDDIAEDDGVPFSRQKTGSTALRRSDFLSKEEDSETSYSLGLHNNYLIRERQREREEEEGSAAQGYIYSADSQDIEIVQTDTSSWDSKNDDDEGLTNIDNWNDGFKKINAKISSFSNNTTTAERVMAYNDLIGLMEDFLLAVRSFGRIIISEAHLPDHERTIPTTSLGGVIGGQKYLVQGILFKFSSDEMGILGRDSDPLSAKIAGHELKGLLACVNELSDEGLESPLMALVDYKGFRLIAMSQMPISKETQALGSCDGGKTVLNKSKELYAKFERLGKSLNLKGHMVGAEREKSQFLYTPIDLEGHEVQKVN